MRHIIRYIAKKHQDIHTLCGCCIFSCDDDDYNVFAGNRYFINTSDKFLDISNDVFQNYRCDIVEFQNGYTLTTDSTDSEHYEYYICYNKSKDTIRIKCKSYYDGELDSTYLLAPYFAFIARGIFGNQNK
jgi:hypothetical protein